MIYNIYNVKNLIKNDSVHEGPGRNLDNSHGKKDDGQRPSLR